MKKILIALLFSNLAWSQSWDGHFEKTHAIALKSNKIVPISSTVHWQQVLRNGEGLLRVEAAQGEFCEIEFSYEIIKKSAAEFSFIQRNRKTHPDSHPACDLIVEFQSLLEIERRVTVNQEKFYFWPVVKNRAEGAVWVYEGI